MSDPPDLPPTTALERFRSLGVKKSIAINATLNRVSLTEVIRSCPIPASEKTALKALLKTSKKDGKYAMELKEKRTVCGRAYPEHYSVASAVSCRGDIRAALFGDTYVELDLVACHPTILANVARQYGIPTPVVDEYLRDRPALLKGVALAFSRSEGDAKTFYNAVLYGSREKCIIGDDGVRRIVDAPMDDMTLDRYRKHLHDFTMEVQDVTSQLLRHPGVQKDFAENLRPCAGSRDAKKLFRLLEVGERCAIQALLDAVGGSGGELKYGEVIFDGALVCTAEGKPPADEVLANLCAKAQDRARERFDLNVKFKAKPLAGGDIFPEGSDFTSSTVVLEKGSIWYISLGGVGERLALGRAQLHAKKRRHRFVLAMQTKVGARYTARADWAGLQGKLQGRDAAVWEVARRNVPIRPFVSFNGFEGPVDEIVDVWRAAMADCGLGEGVPVAVTATATADGCYTLVADVALPSFEAVTLLNERAFGSVDAMAKCVIKTDRVLMVRQAPLEDPGNRRIMVSDGMADSACFSLPADAVSKDCSALFELFDDAARGEVAAAYKDVSWSDAYRVFVRGALPETVSDRDVPSLVLELVKPGDISKQYDASFMQAVAGALWAHCAGGAEAEALAERRFQTWATEDGYNTNIRERVLDVWQTAMRVDAGSCRHAVITQMMDHLRSRAPEIHARWVQHLARAITGDRDEQLPDWFTVMHDQTKMPGPDSIGSIAQLLANYKYIGIDAPPGFGKSMCFQGTTREIIRTKPESSCLVPTTRISVSHAHGILFNPGENGNPGEPLGVKFAHYKDDCDGWVERNEWEHLICELESLVSLRRGYTLALLDEFMTLLLQIASAINKSRFKRLCAVLVQLCKGAEHVIVADALLRSDTFIRFIEVAEGTRVPDVKALYLKYTPAVPSDRVVKMVVKNGSKFAVEDIEGAFEQRFADGERNFFVFTNIKKLVDTIEQGFRKSWTAACGSDGREPRILKLTAATYLAEMRAADGAGVDVWWVLYDMVIVTPTVTNAVSFNVRDHFDSVLAFCSNYSCIPPDVMQACLRPRYTTKNVTHVYVSINKSCGGDSSSVKDHEELMREAVKRDRQATEMEKLVYGLAISANVFAFNFYPVYLRQCFERIGFKVEMMGDALDGETPLPENGDAPPPEYDEVPRVTEQKYNAYFRDKCLTETETVTALRLACDVDVDEAEGPEVLANVLARFKFATNLLNIESGVAGGEDMVLSPDQVKARNELWKMVRGGKPKQLWLARRAYIYERARTSGIGKTTTARLAERLARPDFEHNVMMPWKKRYEVVQNALRSVGLTSAVPLGGAGIVKHERLNLAHEDLVELLPEFNVQFSKGTKSGTARSEEDKVKNAARIFKTVVEAWDPAVTFKATARKRKTVEGGKQRNSDYELTYKGGWNEHGAAELLHSDNLLSDTGNVE